MRPAALELRIALHEVGAAKLVALGFFRAVYFKEINCLLYHILF